MKRINVLITGFIFLCSFMAQAQGKFYTKSGKVTFFSSTSMEDIEAVNKSVVTLLDTKTGDIQFAALMKGFEFKKALMQEHFNKDYAESNKFPKAEFKGQVINNGEINYSANGTYTAKVKGKLAVHGETKDIETTGTITVKDGKLTVNSVFNVLVADYKITIPKLYRDNISKSIKVTVDCALTSL
ncbi:MAG: YceI family protein [Bacteroidota bacterium]